jgi:hypothetical protein
MANPNYADSVLCSINYLLAFIDCSPEFALFKPDLVDFEKAVKEWEAGIVKPFADQKEKNDDHGN